MAFSVNTNIASLQAQEYLRVNSDFQQKTIGRVTSGLRILSSGDDAAGLAIANGYRSDQAVLTQGIRNANDGLSQLQIVDGGLNNISKLLDRARTLATQSASGTFTGSREVLNNEFQTVLSEIDRQAQAIGLNTGGELAKSLSVFIGGGKTSGSITGIQNGSVAVDLSRSTVDASSLGLKGYQATSVTGTDIGNGSATTSVAQILSDVTNSDSQRMAGFTEFVFRGAGFSGSDAIRVSVNLSGVSDTTTLNAAINGAIEAAGNGASPSATAFSNANIKASVVTDANGRQSLAFSSSTNAFQVAAGDRTANALLGNFSAGATGADMSGSVSAGAATVAGTFAASAGNIIVRFMGSSLSAPVDLTLNVTGGTTTVTEAVDDLAAQVSGNAALQAAGISLGANFSIGQTLSLVNAQGEQFEVQVAGDVTNALGFGSWQRSGASFDATSITGAAAPTAGAANLEISVGGGTTFSLAVTSSATLADAQTALNAVFAADSNASAAGLVATNDGTNLIISSANGTSFRVNEVGTNFLGFGNAASVASAASFASTVPAASSQINSGGASNSGLLDFSAIRLGNDDQTITLASTDPTGKLHTLNVTLRNDGSERNGQSIDQAIHSINRAITLSNDSTLQKLVAVKENDGGVEKIRILGANNSFNVTVAANATGNTGITTGQGQTIQSDLLDGGANSDIATQANAEAAVNALSAAVSALGNAQAVVGRGQNQFNYAVNLASSQLTNIAASESRIRDADLAAEAANLTKAQITLQAGIAALAQANSAPQAVLALLRG